MSAATPANVFLGTGRRKTSTARVRVTEGSGKLSVNGRDFEDYFSHENFAKQAYAPLLTVELRDKIDVSANVSGGGVAGTRRLGHWWYRLCACLSGALPVRPSAGGGQHCAGP